MNGSKNSIKDYRHDLADLSKDDITMHSENFVSKIYIIVFI